MTSISGGLPSELTAPGSARLRPDNACDREPIHLSGALQPHGTMLGLVSGEMTVAVADVNIVRALTVAGSMNVLGASIDDLLDETDAEAVRELDALSNPQEALPIRVNLAGSTWTVIGHRSSGLLLLDLEITERTGSFLSDEFFQRQRRVMNDLGSVETVADVCHLAARELRALTGYDRVMVYRFEADAHGHVIAESRRSDLEPYLGLHYPAGDIPRQARALYLRNLIRVIPDVDYEPVPILGIPGFEVAGQLDLGMSALRSVSPVHLQYLRNMGVRATMTVSLVIGGQLWGMIAAHHQTPKQLDLAGRIACETFGQLVSVRLRAAETVAEKEAASDYGRLTAQVITAMAAGESPAAGAVSAKEPLLGMTDADAAVVRIGQEQAEVGDVPGGALLTELIGKMAAVAGSGPKPYATDALPPQFTEDAAGALYLPLQGQDGGFVLWLRKERLSTVRWAGHDQKTPGNGEHEGLTPRASFAEWREEVRGRSRPWTNAQISAATELNQAMPDVLLHRSNNRLIRLALHDPLTGLPNRLLLRERLGQMVSTPQAELQRAVLYVDIDGFKAINDNLGHGAGDDLLVQASQRISSVLRSDDTVARMGGDEFVVLLPSSESPLEVGQRIVEAFRRPFVLESRVTRTVTVSVGVTSISSGIEVSQALGQADAALYHAKRSGRNQVALFDPSTGLAAEGDQHASRELRAAIGSGELIPVFQPIADLSSGRGPRLEGFEALARWYHPTRGVIPPDEFIPLAERTGLIDSLGDAILRQSLEQLRRWGDPTLTLAVNVSVLQLVRPGFTQETIDQLVESGIAPHRLILEITESQLMQQPDQARIVLDELAAIGVQIAIDDFGTGYSSLTYVRDLPARILKIDRSFVSGLPDNAKDVAVVGSTIRLARELGMQTVAEGVERVEQLQALAQLGSNFAQGYLFGRPLPPQDTVLELPSWIHGHLTGLVPPHPHHHVGVLPTQPTAAERFNQPQP